MLRDKSFLLRVLSALFAALVLLGAYLWQGTYGLSLACLLVCLLSLREFKRLLVLPNEPLAFSLIFSTLSLLLVLALFLFRLETLTSLSVIQSLYVGAMIVVARERVSNDRLLRLITLGLFGVFYCILCPWLAAQLLLFPNGARWFLFLLLVIFAGDTFAFFGGKFFGRHKLNPSLSPKKTMEGALVGVFGSLTASFGFWFFARPDLSLALILAFGLVGGIVGQTGDLLMSLIKRVSQVKDSGRLLPGHGGVLDRIDGVLLACPVIYTLAKLAH